jgi:hypothetical protein
MAEVPKTVTVHIDIESGDLAGVVEQIVAQSFAQGYAHGLRQADQEPGNRIAVEQAYEDWRGWGPGARLPGGSVFRERTEALERMAGDLQEVLADDKPVVCIRHRTHVPCRHGSPEDPCLETDDPRAVALTTHYQRAIEPRRET